MIYIGTTNLHKFHEIKDILRDYNVKLEMTPKKIEVEEDGESFYENSVKKAYYYGIELSSPVICDDSGLVIESLNGFPGVKSARFMEGKTYKEKMEELIKRLESFEDKSAKFICVATYFNPKNGILISAKGEVKGNISQEIKGEQGFGYDPFFVPEGYEKTFGELGEKVKREISHRSRAFRKLFSILKKVGEI